jgi:hypothetical protein
MDLLLFWFNAQKHPKLWITDLQSTHVTRYPPRPLLHELVLFLFDIVTAASPAEISSEDAIILLPTGHDLENDHIQLRWPRHDPGPTGES